MRTLSLIVVVISMLGCGEPREVVPPAQRPAAASIDLRDANVTELVGQLSRALAMPVRVDTDAVPRAQVDGEPAIELPPLPSPQPPPPTDGIRWLSENTYEVDPRSAAFEGAPANLMTQARIIPHMEAGQVVGLRLYGVRPTSLLASLGFQNGDTITHVDGQPVTGMEMLLESYARHRDFERLTVEITRRGQPITFTYLRPSSGATEPAR